MEEYRRFYWCERSGLLPSAGLIPSHAQRRKAGVGREGKSTATFAHLPQHLLVFFSGGSLPHLHLVFSARGKSLPQTSDDLHRMAIIQNLPTEILMEVCKSLTTQDTSNLSKTCRWLCTKVQPIIYSHLYLQRPSEKQLETLLRTLRFCRPLARRVTRLDIDDFEDEIHIVAQVLMHTTNLCDLEIPFGGDWRIRRFQQSNDGPEGPLLPRLRSQALTQHSPAGYSPYVEPISLHEAMVLCSAAPALKELRAASLANSFDSDCWRPNEHSITHLRRLFLGPHIYTRLWD